MVYSSNTQLSFIIAENPSVLSLLNRLGIFLGVGNSSVNQSAIDHDIDPDFLLVMINTYLNHDYFPEKEFVKFPINGICDYLIRANRFYIDVQLPNVARHFRHLVTTSDSVDNNLNKLFEYFLTMEKRFHLELDKYNSLLNKVVNRDPDLVGKSYNTLIFLVKENIYPLVESLNDLINLFIIHLKGNCDPNLCHAVINALITLSDDMKQNNRIHDRILSPSLLSLAEND